MTRLETAESPLPLIPPHHHTSPPSPASYLSPVSASQSSISFNDYQESELPESFLDSRQDAYNIGQMAQEDFSLINHQMKLQLLAPEKEARLRAVKFLLLHSQERATKTACLTELKKLAQKGYDDAQYYLAYLYIKGPPVKNENGEIKYNPLYSKALYWLALASKKDHYDALYLLGECYEYGRGKSKSFQKAVHSYRRSSVGNHPGAMYKLGMALLRGQLGFEQNTRDGLKWLKLSAKYANQEFPESLYELAMLHDVGVRNFVWTDHTYLIELLKQAAELGHAPSMFKLAEAYRYGRFEVEMNPGTCFHYYTQAAERGHHEAMFEIAGWYLTGYKDDESGFFLNQSDDLAYQYFERSSRAFPKAAYVMGYLNEQGIGCPKSIINARLWYTKSALDGNPKAVQWCKMNFVKLSPKSANDDKSIGFVDSFGKKFKRLIRSLI